MSRFRPTLEPLGARTLPSAVAFPPDDPTAGAPAAQLADEPAGREAPAAEETGTSTGKVRLSDFNFTARVSKASPMLN